MSTTQQIILEGLPNENAGINQRGFFSVQLIDVFYHMDNTLSGY